MDINNFKDKFKGRMGEVVPLDFIEDVTPPDITEPNVPDVPPDLFSGCGKLEEQADKAFSKFEEGRDYVKKQKNKISSAVKGVSSPVTEPLRKLKKNLDGRLNELRSVMPDIPDFEEFETLPDTPDNPLNSEKLPEEIEVLKACPVFPDEHLDELSKGIDEAPANVLKELLLSEIEGALESILDKTPLGKLRNTKDKLDRAMSRESGMVGTFNELDDIIACIQASCDSWSAYEERKEKLAAEVGIEDDGLVKPDKEVPEHLKEEVDEQEALISEIQYKVEATKSPDTAFPHLGKNICVNLPLLGGNEYTFKGIISKKYTPSKGVINIIDSDGKVHISGEYNPGVGEIELIFLLYRGGVTTDIDFNILSVSNELELILSGEPTITLNCSLE